MSRKKVIAAIGIVVFIITLILLICLGNPYVKTNKLTPEEQEQLIRANELDALEEFLDSMNWESQEARENVKQKFLEILEMEETEEE